MPPEGSIIDNILAHAKEIDGQLEHLKHMDTPLPIEIEVIQDTTYLPGAEEFKDFYDELNIYGISTTETGNGIVKIKSGAGKTVVFGIRAIANIVADKLNMPIPIDTDQEIAFAGKPNFVENVDALLKARMDWVQAEFRKILDFNDKRIEKLCQDYHKLHSIPIIALCEYLKWERQYLNYRLQTETAHIQDKKASEVREIRNEYNANLDKEKGKVLQRAENAETEFSRLRQAYETERRLGASRIDEINAQKGEMEELHRKFTESSSKNTKLEEDLRIAKVELEKLREKVKKTEGDWIQSPTMSLKPAFKNEATKDVFTFPCTIEEFKSQYQLVKSEDGLDIFETKDHTEISVPEGVIKKISQTTTQASDTDIKGKKVNKKGELTEADLKVLKSIQDSDEPISIVDIEAVSGVKKSNLQQRHLQHLLDAEEIIMEKGEDGIKRYSVP